MYRPILLAALLLTATAAQAQPEAPPEGSLRGRLFIAPMGEPFRGPDGLKTWFARADENHDGKITLAEFQAEALPFFQKLDANHDGKIDGFEEQAYERDVVPEITGLYGDHAAALLEGGPPPGAKGRPKGGGKPSSGGQQMRRAGAGRYGLLNVPQPVSGSDLELDGKVTLAEWTKTGAIRFGMLDTTKAGVLTLETLPGAAPPPAKTR